MENNLIEIKNLKKSFGEIEVLKGIDFSIKKGDVSCIIGPSGSGKSTFLRCINLLDYPTSGEIIYKGENVLKNDYNVDLYRSKVGMVFQQFNLFNNMDVLENCIIGQVKVL
ncbi:MAG: amino acid ABC transporter ATP-binding protein [Clostridia bacterium]|nr:amino acid ABC transporter ATP-binding protein [Clostridia bacterium]